MLADASFLQFLRDRSSCPCVCVLYIYRYICVYIYIFIYLYIYKICHLVQKNDVCILCL